MKFIDIATIVIIVVLIYTFFLFLWDAWKLRRLRKKYKEDKDASKQGERRRKAGEAVKLRARELSNERFIKPQPRELLPTATSDKSGINKDSFGKPSDSNGQPSKIDKLLSELFKK